MSRLLNEHELISLRRGLARRTGGRLQIKSGRITVIEGIALWKAAASFEQPRDAAARAGNHKHLSLALTAPGTARRLVGSGASLAAVASLAGCATLLGGNVKGSFACRAPDGICAPTTNIDDAALAVISGETGASVPAGPYVSPRGFAQRGSTTASAQPVRSDEKVLRIVFPAHIDGSGRYREASAIHAVVERGDWMTAGKGRAAPVQTSMLQTPEPQSRADVLPAMPTLGDLASSAPEMQFPSAVADIDARNSAEAAAVETVPTVSSAAAVSPRREKSFTGFRKRAAPARQTALSAPAASSPVAAPIALAAPQASSGNGAQVIAAPTREAVPVKPTSAKTTIAAPIAPAAVLSPMAAIKDEVSKRLGSGTRATGIAAGAAATLPAMTTNALRYSLPAGSTANRTSASGGASGSTATVAPVSGPSMFPASDVQP